MSTRANLIADWQSRLHAAESASNEGSQLTWLVRARLRLYRFLLSLYGDGGWSADARDSRDTEIPATDSAESLVVIDSPDALPFQGKPAKAAGKIQAALKSLANANDAPPAGPLVAGLEPDSWVIAASERKGRSIPRCAALLVEHSLVHQIVQLGKTQALEVRAADLRRALFLIESIRTKRQRRSLIAPAPRILVRRSDQSLIPSFLLAFAALLAIPIGPLLGVACRSLAEAALHDFPQQSRELVGSIVFLIAWIGPVIATMAFLVSPLARSLAKYPFTRS